MLSTDSLPNADQTPRKAMTPNRRSVVRAAAWATPAVVVASAAPAFATTGGSAPVLNPRGGGQTAGSLSLRSNSDVLVGDVSGYYSFVPQAGTVKVPALTVVIEIAGGWVGGSAEFYNYFTTAPPLMLNDEIVRDGLLWEVTTLEPGRIILSTAGGEIPGSIETVNTPRVYVEGELDSGPDRPVLSILLSGISGLNPGSDYYMK